MTASSPFGLRDAPLLAEALLTLVCASAAIRLLPFRRIGTLAASRAARASDGDVATLRRAVDAWARRVPWKAMCFQRGLALHLMARRRGVASVLHYGVAQDPAEGLIAHVWVDVGGHTVIGGEEAPRFRCLASFPPTT